MYYFIPAWYGSGSDFWQADIIPWYFRQKKMEFDDSLHQLRIFQGQDLHPKLLLLTYQPHLRYFLHRHDILEVDYLSVFDAIQGIENHITRQLHVTDLDWDEDCDFIYTPFIIRVEKSHQLYAEIELGSEGYLSLVRYFDHQQLVREEVYDDRGFVSSVLYFENGQAIYRNYLDAKGVWQLCHFLDGRGIVANPRTNHRFEKSYYQTMEEVIWEFFDAYLQETLSPDDRLVLASDSNHNQQILKHLPQDNQKILTIFSERNQGDDWLDYREILRECDLVILDQADEGEAIRHHFPDQAHKLQVMAPSDTRLALGKSQRVKESKIYYQIGKEALAKQALSQVLNFVAAYPTTEVVFALFNAQAGDLEQVERAVTELIEQQFTLADFEKAVEVSSAENQLIENQETSYRYRFVNLLDETDLIKELAYTRLIVDLNDQPHHYTQIAGISAGIPQINRRGSAYVTHLENGYILETLTDFEKAAYYYLGQLKHWNQALIAAIDKIRENTGDRFVDKWDNWLKEEPHA